MVTVQGNCAIVRTTSPGDVESNLAATEVIQFDLSSITNQKGHVEETRFRMITNLSENPNPLTNKLNDLQDTGFAFAEGQIVGFIESPTVDVSLTSTTLLNWKRNFKTNTNFPFGRFGVRTNDFPAFNMSPNATSGMILYDVEVIKPTEYKYLLEFIFKIRYNGDPTRIGTYVS